MIMRVILFCEMLYVCSGPFSYSCQPTNVIATDNQNIVQFHQQQKCHKIDVR